MESRVESRLWGMRFERGKMAGLNPNTCGTVSSGKPHVGVLLVGWRYVSLLVGDTGLAIAMSAVNVGPTSA